MLNELADIGGAALSVLSPYVPPIVLSAVLVVLLDITKDLVQDHIEVPIKCRFCQSKLRRADRFCPTCGKANDVADL